MVVILLTEIGDAQHLRLANGTHIAWLIRETPTEISSELPHRCWLGSPWNVPNNIGCVLGPDTATKVS